jgi:hypothetical protein
MLSMRKEGNLRQHVLDILIDWIQNPELVSSFVSGFTLMKDP